MSIQEKSESLYPMNISLILAHPSQKSFNHALAETAVDELQRIGHRVQFHDLYAEKFDPVLPADEIVHGDLMPENVKHHCTEIANADGIVIVHPNWWGQPPAILKGWVDRVLCAGVAYRFLEGDEGEGIPVGLLKAKAVCIFNTSNTQVEREINIFGDPLETIWKNCIFDLCGIKTVHREMFRVVVTSTPEEREAWLNHARLLLRKYFC
jgi:NAD(P)H dehydrogenase (quinone)